MNSFPGSAWERDIREALPRVNAARIHARRSLAVVRSQAEPGNEILTSYGEPETYSLN
jgi:hypothetical protein